MPDSVAKQLPELKPQRNRFDLLAGRGASLWHELAESYFEKQKGESATAFDYFSKYRDMERVVTRK